MPNDSDRLHIPKTAPRLDSEGFPNQGGDFVACSLYFLK